mmetsp:Transcript_26332/g.62776  ORF Transcript_26332/g.62776 Transcript_26332/m.62776 type:complete len:252 (-) Transcript_26332:133-888(-)
MERSRWKRRTESAPLAVISPSCTPRSSTSSERSEGSSACRWRSCVPSSSPHFSSSLAEDPRCRLPAIPSTAASPGGGVTPTSWSSASRFTASQSAAICSRTDACCTRSDCAVRRPSSAPGMGPSAGETSSACTPACRSSHCSANCAALAIRWSVLFWHSCSHDASRSCPQQSRSDASLSPSRAHTAGWTRMERSTSRSVSKERTSAAWRGTTSAYRAWKDAYFSDSCWAKPRRLATAAVSAAACTSCARSS